MGEKKNCRVKGYEDNLEELCSFLHKDVNIDDKH
jgi:hypothetical protein